MKKLYEHEINRNFVTPKQFFTYCKKTAQQERY